MWRRVRRENWDILGGFLPCGCEGRGCCRIRSRPAAVGGASLPPRRGRREAQTLPSISSPRHSVPCIFLILIVSGNCRTVFSSSPALHSPVELRLHCAPHPLVHRVCQSRSGLSLRLHMNLPILFSRLSSCVRMHMNFRFLPSATPFRGSDDRNFCDGCF